MENNLKEMVAVGTGHIAGAGVNKDGTPYNAGTATDTFGEPPVMGKINLLNRPSLLPNTSKKKPLRNILDPKTTIGRA